MGRSYIADAIVNEYRMKQYYKNKKRQNCKEKECDKCSFNDICKNERNDEECQTS